MRKVAGLPNIIGTQGIVGANNTGFWSENTTGVYTTWGNGTGDFAQASTTGHTTKGFNFNASRSSSVYGSSETVTPLSLTSVYAIKY